MSMQPLSGIAHLGKIIDKIRLRHAGQIQDYNDSTVGFNRYLSTSSNWTPLHSSTECVTEILIRNSWTGSARTFGAAL